jgi:ABC-2 type transport system ATP-binding protein
MALLEGLGLQQRATSLIGAYSHGMRQRLGIARALVNDPVVVFFDEPTLGLDPRGQKELLALVRRTARERNAGVILCSHALMEIESVCDDVVILNTGQVVAAGTVAEVIGRTQPDVMQRSGIRIHVAPQSVGEAQQRLESLPNVAKVTPTDEEAGWLQVELEQVSRSNGDSPVDPYTTNQILEALIRAGIPILSMQADGGGLHDAFLHLTEETIR